MLMFTNQLNQLYNITTYDIPVAFRNKNYREAGRSAISLATMAMMIWMIQERDIPDEPEDAAQALGESFLGSIPVFGSTITSSMHGWQPRAATPFQAVYEAVRAVDYAYQGDFEKAVGKLVEPISIGVGLPYQSAKEAYQFIEEVR
jgi:hypothetical protein